MKLLITGANGQLGQCLRDVLASQPQLQAVFLDRSQLDLSSAASIKGVVARYQPDWLINAAAYTAVDKAESQPELAHQINATAPGLLAQQCAELGIPMLQVSTDYVFAGQGNVPYKPHDPIQPLGVYGASKAAGEAAVREACAQHLILRTAWVYSEYGNNFLKTMLRVGAERAELKVVDDQQGCPTYAGDIARAILAMVQHKNPEWGIYHYVGGVSTSWCNFAQLIFDLACEEGLLEHRPLVLPIESSQYPTPAKRPAWSVLDTGSTTGAFGIPAGPYEASVRHAVRQLAAQSKLQAQ